MVQGHIFDIERYSIRDGPGIRTTVFLQGCPLSCWWCHNPESQAREPGVHYRRSRCIGCGECVESCPEGALATAAEGIERDDASCTSCGTCADTCPSLARERVARQVDAAEVLAEIERDRLFYDQSGGGVTFSGGEPLAQPEFLLELLRACGERGLHRAVDTCGLAQEDQLLEIAVQTDLFLFDLKLMDPERHREVTGASNERILANLRRLCTLGYAVHVRIPLIAGINDGRENVERTAEFLGSLPGLRGVSLLPFHRAARQKHREFGLAWHLDDAAQEAEPRTAEIASHLEACGLSVSYGASQS